MDNQQLNNYQKLDALNTAGATNTIPDLFKTIQKGITYPVRNYPGFQESYEKLDEVVPEPIFKLGSNIRDFFETYTPIGTRTTAENMAANFNAYDLPKELIPKLKEFNLQLCSGWYGANLRTNSIDEEKDLIQDQLKLFKDCNSPCMVFAEVSGSIQGDPDRKLSTRPQMNLEESKKYYEKISEMGKYLEDEGMPLAYHHHMGTVIETEEDTVRLLENTHDSVKLTLDTGHMLFAQGDSLKILNDFSERLIHMHCKDIRKSVLEKSLKEDLSFRGAFLEGAFTVPGDGCIDYKPLFDVLKKKNY